MVLRSGSTSEMSSYFGPDQVTAVTDAPSIKRDREERADDLARSLRLVERQAARQGYRAPTCRCAAWVPMAPQLRKEFKLDAGRMMFKPGHQRDHRGRRRREAVRGPRGRQDRALGQDRLDGRRAFHRRRRHRRVRGLGAMRAVVQQAWQRGPQLPDHARQAGRGRCHAQGSQGRADQGSAAHGRRAQREARSTSISRRSCRRSSTAWAVRIAIIMGLAAIVRGAEHARERGRQPRARDRHAARHGFRRGPGGVLGAGRGHDPRRHRRVAGRRDRIRCS